MISISADRVVSLLREFLSRMHASKPTARAELWHHLLIRQAHDGRRVFRVRKISLMIYAGFIALTIFLAVVIYIGASVVAGKAYGDTTRAKQFKVRTALLFTVWLVYAGVISATGIFTVSSLPPRVPLLLVLPVFVFFAYFFTNAKFKPIIANTPPSWLVYFQSFRIIVELLLLGLYLNSMLPKAATFEGYNYDILIGITAPLVGYFAFKGAMKKPLLRIWNVAGIVTLFVVVFIIMTYAYFPQLWDTGSITGNGAFQFPYMYLASFLMPIALFMHIFSLVKMKAV